jgi:hypothetical protein
MYDGLLKFASKNPDLREDWGPVLDSIYAEMRQTRVASRNKIAYSEDTVRFINWVTLTQKRSPVSEKDAQDMLERTFNLETRAPASQSRGGPRFQVGDMVKIKAKKHKIGHTMDIYKKFDQKVGTVVKTPREDSSLSDDSDHGDALVQFGSGAPVRIPDAMKARGVGIYKDDSSYDMKSSGRMLEMIYFSSKERPPTQEAMQEVENYIERGDQVGEDRVPYYYSGVPQMAAYSKQGNFYFKINPQQRTSKWRAYSPKKGTLLYLGVMGSRPSGWEREYEKLMHETA